MSNIETLRSRLFSPDASVRRIAIHDLIRIPTPSDEAMTLLLDHLPQETDEKAALAIIRHLAAAKWQAARPILWQLHENPQTAAAIAHAALIAHDELEGHAKRAMHD